MVYTVLTIAGSDPSGGAGVQADLLTLQEFGIKGLSAITALTAQTHEKVFSVNPVPADNLTQQMFTASNREKIDAVKIGMIGSSGNVRAIVMFLRAIRPLHIVLDPVFVSTSGTPLLEKNAMHHFKNELLPLATVVTPNLDEAETLTGMHVWNIGTMKEAARQIHSEASNRLAVLVKGGHIKGDPVDILYDGERFTEFPAKRIGGPNRRGTGCRLASAIAANLAKGVPLVDAVKEAKKFVEEHIKNPP